MKGKTRMWCWIEPPVLEWWREYAGSMGAKPSGLLAKVATAIAKRPELMDELLKTIRPAAIRDDQHTGAHSPEPVVTHETAHSGTPGEPRCGATEPEFTPVHPSTSQYKVQVQVPYWGEEQHTGAHPVNATVHRPPEPPPPGETKASPWATLAQDLTDAYSPGWDDEGFLHPARTFEAEHELGQVRLAADPRDTPEAILAAAKGWPSRQTNPGLLTWVKGRMWRRQVKRRSDGALEETRQRIEKRRDDQAEVYARIHEQRREEAAALAWLSELSEVEQARFRAAAEQRAGRRKPCRDDLLDEVLPVYRKATGGGAA